MSLELKNIVKGTRFFGSITKRRAHVGRTFDTKNGDKKRSGIHRGERKLLKNSC